MINENSLKAAAKLAFGRHFVRPAYGGYCFAHIPATIQGIFGLTTDTPLPAEAIPDGGPYERVVMLFVDAFGWNIFQRYADDFAFLRELAAGGVVSQMTSMFPSTTAAHVTSIHTGLPVGQSGVYEWFYYEPQVEQVIAPLLFSVAGEKGRDGLVRLGVKAASIFPEETLYQSLAQAGVASYNFTPGDYAKSPYNSHVTRGSDTIPYYTWSEAMTNLGLLLEKRPSRLYVSVYFSGIDSIAHPYGPNGLHAENEAISFLTLMERFLNNLRRSAAGGGRTLLLLTADHGQASTDPATTIYLNRRFSGFQKYLKRNPQGQPILFGGSPRDLFLYIQEQALEEAEALLKEGLEGKAEVWRTGALIEAGLFGPQPVSEALLGRLGNLVILPYPGEAVFWYEADKFEQKYFGHHGGLTREEMFIPLAAYPLK